jgi:hypothetical protein
MTNQMMAAAAERTSAADIQQLVQCSRCSAAGAGAAAGAAQVQQPVLQQQHQLVQHKCNNYAATGVIQLVQEQ